MLSSALRRSFGAFLFCALLAGCAGMNPLNPQGDTVGMFRPDKHDVASYEAAGKRWGERHWNMKIQANNTSDRAFVESLIDSNNLDFFWVHAELKDAFKKGYRMGYQDRTADLVLGPYLTDAAAMIGERTSGKFVNVIETFERDWGETLSRAINVFITLISEGSQADREKFIANFEKVYDAKYRKTQAALHTGGFVTQTSEGGTTLYLDARRTVAVLNIPSTSTLKTEVYQQTFKVMGDEWGRRFSTNLIKRDELIDLLRRSKTALDEVPPRLSGNLATVRDSFEHAYGTDGRNVFAGLASAAGYAGTGGVSAAAPKNEPEVAAPKREAESGQKGAQQRKR